MDDTRFLWELFDNKLLSVLTLFLENKNSNLYLREVATKCKVPVATTFRILKRLVALDILKINQINKFKFYQIQDNERVKQLEALISKDPLERFVSAVKLIEGIKAVLLYGNKGERSANVMIIGNQPLKEQINKAVQQVKSKYGFDIKYLTFSVEQFQQMTSMGMYSQPKKVLWKSI